MADGQTRVVVNAVVVAVPRMYSLLSLIARQHQERFACSTTAARVALPASKRPRTETPCDPPPAVGELLEELTDTDVQIVNSFSNGTKGGIGVSDKISDLRYALIPPKITGTGNASRCMSQYVACLYTPGPVFALNAHRWLLHHMI